MLFAATCIGRHISHMDADYISNSKRCFFCFAFGPGFFLLMFICFPWIPQKVSYKATGRFQLIKACVIQTTGKTEINQKIKKSRII
jgi:hypothetical protein